MGWGVKTEARYEGEDTKTNQYGTRTPNLSEDFTTAYRGYRDSLNPSGLNSTQQGVVDWAQGRLNNNPTTAAIRSGNEDLGNISRRYDDIINRGPNLLGAAPQATAGQADFVGADGAPTINAKTGREFMDAYMSPYTQNVVDTTLASFDRQAGKSANALRASRGAGSAFGDRAYLDDQSFWADSDLNRALGEANIRNLGFTTAAGLGMQDAGRFLDADRTNAANILANNQFNAGQRNSVNMFNAGQRTGTSQFNTGIQNTRDISDQASRNTFDQTAINALNQQGNLTQQQIDNVVTANGIDMEMADALFRAGSIGPEQLSILAQLATAGNGYSYTQNGSSNRDTYGGSVSANFGV